MTKVIFEFNEEYDLERQWYAAKVKNGELEGYHDKNSFYDRVNSMVTKICKGREFTDCKEELREYLNFKYYSNPIFSTVSKSLESVWRSVENEFFKKMNKLMKHKCDFEIKAFIHTGILTECKYSTFTYMISARHHAFKFLVNSGHEIMHLYFKRFYRDFIERKIGKEKTRDLSESLTVLLNEEFKDLWIFNDSGYSKHKELRAFIVEKWREENDFEKLLDKCVEYLKDK